MSGAMGGARTQTSEWTWRRLGRDRTTWWAGPLAVGLAVATFVHLGEDWNAAVFAGAQVVFVVLAGIDLATRRLPNAITVPGVLAAVALRALFDRSHLAEVAIAGVAALAAFLVVSIVLRGGLGMGDVKLAGLLGALLGWPAFDALAIGIVVGGIVSLGLLVVKRAGLGTAIAYGPCLALGGAVGILALHPPPLV